MIKIPAFHTFLFTHLPCYFRHEIRIILTVDIVTCRILGGFRQASKSFHRSLWRGVDEFGGEEREIL